MSELLTPSELAERLKVSHATIAKWRKRGIIPAICINPVTYRFEFESVVRALQERSGQKDEAAK